MLKCGSRLLRHTPVLRLYRMCAVARWVTQGMDGPPPHEFKAQTLKCYARRYGLKQFVETGTYMGAMLDSMRSAMDQMWSVELSSHLYERAVMLFRHDPHIHILHGNSANVLPQIIDCVTGPCLFWLDAHYSGGITAGDNEGETPLMQELSCILSHLSSSDHVILIDDARCLDGHKGYPRIAEIETLVHYKSPKMNVASLNDIVRITPKQV